MTRRDFNLFLAAAGFIQATRPLLAAPASNHWKVIQEFRHVADINVEQVDFSPQTQALASWAPDGSLCVWSLKSKNQILMRQNDCTLVGFQGKRLIYNQKGATRIFDIATQAESAFNIVMEPSAISPNGDVWAGLRGGNPAVFNSRTSTMTSLSAPPSRYRTDPRCFHFAGDSKSLTLIDSVRALLWDLDKPDDPIILPDQPAEVTSARLSKDGKVVCLSSRDGTIEFYDRFRRTSLRVVRLGAEIRYLALDRERNQVLAACSDDKKSLFSVNVPPTPPRNTLPPEPVQWDNGGEAWASWIGGDIAVTGHRGGLVRLWKYGRG